LFSPRLGRSDVALLALVVIVLALWSHPGWGQDSSAPASSGTPSAAGSTEPIALPGVTVPGLVPQGYVVPDAAIGTKIDTPLLRLPFSVEVIPRALMNDQGATRLKDALKNVSGVIPGGYYEG
jgi:outer membrane receptor protein involved in Fe transport